MSTGLVSGILRHRSERKRYTPRRIVVMSSLLAALALAVATPVAADDTMTLSITGGSLTAQVVELSLNAVPFSYDDQISTGTITLAVEDASGGGQGWNVTIQATDFIYSGTNTSATDIPAANLTISTANTATVADGQAVDPVGGPKVPADGATGTLDLPRTVLQANAGYGQGSYEQTLDVQLDIPGNSAPGSYASTVTVSVMAGP